MTGLSPDSLCAGYWFWFCGTGIPFRSARIRPPLPVWFPETAVLPAADRSMLIGTGVPGKQDSPVCRILPIVPDIQGRNYVSSLFMRAIL
jgi:hypothetical protein